MSLTSRKAIPKYTGAFLESGHFITILSSIVKWFLIFLVMYSVNSVSIILPWAIGASCKPGIGLMMMDFLFSVYVFNKFSNFFFPVSFSASLVTVSSTNSPLLSLSIFSLFFLATKASEEIPAI